MIGDPDADKLGSKGFYAQDKKRTTVVIGITTSFTLLLSIVIHNRSHDL